MIIYVLVLAYLSDHGVQGVERVCPEHLLLWPPPGCRILIHQLKVLRLEWQIAN